MEYRGKHYTVVRGTEPAVWKWTVDLITSPVNSGEARSRSAAVSAIVLLVDKALMQKLGSPRTNERKS